MPKENGKWRKIRRKEVCKVNLKWMTKGRNKTANKSKIKRKKETGKLKKGLTEWSEMMNVKN